MKVKIVLCRPKIKFPIIAWVIMMFQGMNPFRKSSFSHMAVLYVDCVDKQRAIDATGSHGVDDRIFNKFYDQYQITKMYVVDLNATHECFARWSNTQEEKYYDKAGIIGLALKQLGIVKKNPFGHNWRKMTCNEIVLSLFQTFYDRKIGDSDNYDLIMTKQLVESIQRESELC